MADQQVVAEFDMDTKAFRRTLRARIKQIKIETEQELLKLGYQAGNHAKAYCAVETGRLRASITVAAGRDARGYFVTIGDERQLRVLRRGRTCFMNPQPLLRPAILETVMAWRPVMY